MPNRVNFEYTAGADDRPHTPRLWVGALIDPKDTVGVVVSNGFENVSIVLPNDRVPDLIDVLQRAIKKEAQS